MLRWYQTIVANHELLGAIDPLFPLGREGIHCTQLHVMYDDGTKPAH